MPRVRVQSGRRRSVSPGRRGATVLLGVGGATVSCRAGAEFLRKDSAGSLRLARLVARLGGLVVCALAGSHLGRAQEPAAAQVVEALERVQIEAIGRAERSVVAIARVRTDAPPGRRPLGPVDPTSPDFVPNEYGTGVVVERTGLILTNYHVLGDPAKNDYYVWVRRRPFEAKVHQVDKVLAADPWTDLAVLKIDADDLEPIPLGDGQQLKKGMFVVALGNPYAIARDGQVSASFGIISNTLRRMPAREDADRDRPPAGASETVHHFGTLLQTDARLNLGTSGGALVNLKGEMIGLITAAAVATGYEKSAGFAIPVDQGFRRTLEILKAGRQPEYGFLGVHPTDLSRFDRRRGAFGAQIDQVIRGTPAALAGLQVHDVITHFNGAPVHGRNDLFRELGKQPAGASVELTVTRGITESAPGEQLKLVARLSKKHLGGPRPGIAQSEPPRWRGLQVDYSTALPAVIVQQQSQLVDLSRCVGVVHVEPDSPAWKAGFREGDFINQVSDQDVASPEEFHAAVKNATGAVQLRLARSEGAAAVRVVLP